MIEIFKAGDLKEVMSLWLTGNIKAHRFIPAQRWHHFLNQVQEVLPQAAVYVYRNGGEEIIGFVGVENGEYVAGLFVDEAHQRKGIGKKLLDICKSHYPCLALDVFIQNQQAVAFYQKNGFIVKGLKMSEYFNALEYHMVWEREPGFK